MPTRWHGSLSVEKTHPSSAGFTVNTTPRPFSAGAKAWRWTGTPQVHARTTLRALLSGELVSERGQPHRLRHPPGI